MSSIGTVSIDTYKKMYASEIIDIITAIKYEAQRRNVGITDVSVDIGESIDDTKFITILENLK